MDILAAVLISHREPATGDGIAGGDVIMHAEPREEGVFLNTELVVYGVRDLIISDISNPDDAVPYHERRIYIRGANGEMTTIILRSTPGRRSTDLNITYCGAGSLLTS